MKITVFITMLVLSILEMISTAQDEFEQSTFLLAKQEVVEDTIKKFDNLLKLKWEVELRNANYSIPIIENGIAFLPEEMFFAVDITSGAKLFFDNAEHQRIFRSRISDSLIYIYDDYETKLIDIYNGKKREFYNKPFSWFSYQKEIFVKDTILIQTYGQKELKAIYIKNMWRTKHLWRKKIENRVRGSIITRDTLAFFSNYNYLYILNKKNGKEIWKKEAKNGIYSSLSFDKNLLFTITYKDEKTRELWCVDVDKLELKWKYKFSSDGLHHGIQIEKDKLYFIGEQGIISINKMNGKLLSIYKGNYRSWDISIVSDYIIVFDRILDYDGDVITAINKHTGKITYQYYTSEGFPHVPTEYSEAELEHMASDGSLSEIMEVSKFEYASFTFTKVPNTNVVLALIGDTFAAFEVIKK